MFWKIFIVFLCMFFAVLYAAENVPEIILNEMTEEERAECLKNSQLTNERYIIRVGNKSGFIDGCGVERVAPLYDSVLEFSEGLARVEKDRKYGYIDKSGKIVIPLQYDDAWFFREGTAKVMRRNDWSAQWMFIDKNGKSLCNQTFQQAFSYSNGTALVYDGRNALVLNSDGKILTTYNISKIKLKETDVYLKKRERYGFVMNFGLMSTTYWYDYAGQKFYVLPVDKQIDYAEKKVSQGVQKITEAAFSDVTMCEDGSFIAKSSEKDGTMLYSSHGKRVFEVLADKMSCLQNNKIIYQKGNKQYLYDVIQKKTVLILPGYVTGKDVTGKTTIHAETMKFFDGKILFEKRYCAKGKDVQSLELMDDSLKKTFIKITPSGSLELFNRENEDIRILKWKKKMYYIDKNYKIFWMTDTHAVQGNH